MDRVLSTFPVGVMGAPRGAVPGVRLGKGLCMATYDSCSSCRSGKRVYGCGAMTGLDSGTVTGGCLEPSLCVLMPPATLHGLYRAILPPEPASRTVCPFLARPHTWNPAVFKDFQCLPPSVEMSTPEVPQARSRRFERKVTEER